MKRAGFTLIELLVVIAVIAILSGILFPVYSKVRQQGYKTACLNNLKQIGMAMILYTQDYEDRMPSTVDANGRYWYDQIYGYVRNREIFTCPCDSTVKRSSDNSLLGVVSYCYRDEYLELDENRNPVAWLPLSGCVTSMVTYSCETAIMRDTKANPDVTAAQSSGAYAITNQYGEFDSGGMAPSFPGQPNGWGPGFHSDGENFLYLDGHVKWLPHRMATQARLDWF
jgi:prepilin-type N-terminal cleavage/methylation domain-containing protein/prepilin-type processing-associated H-X9-DG protein